MQSDILTTIYSQHTVYLQRVAASQGRDVLPYLENIENDIQKIFNKYRDRAKTAKNQEAITKAIDESVKKNLKLYTTELNKSQREIGAYEAGLSVDSLESAIEDDINPVKPTNAAINAAAIATPIQLGEKSYTTYKSMLSNYRNQWANEISSQVALGFYGYKTINEVADKVYSQVRLQKTPVSKNVLNRAAKSAKAVAVNGTNHYANVARVEFGKQNADIVKGYILIAVLDSNTSQKCRGLDQRFIPFDSPDLAALTPPLHRNCRTALSYDVDDKYKLDPGSTKRASKFEVDGKVDPKPLSSEGIYYDKMSDLDAADQDVILGPTLGKAFRKLDDPSEFAQATIDRLGNPLTIEEMKSKNNKLGKILRKQSSG